MGRAIFMLAGLALLLGGAGHANAGTLIGQLVQGTYYAPDINSPAFSMGPTQLINPTATFDVFGYATPVVSANQITITLNTLSSWEAFPFSGPVFDFLGSGSLITGVTVDGATNMVGFDSSRVTLAADGSGGQLIEVNWQGLHFNSNTNVTLDVATQGQVAPEPTTLTLLGIGIAGLVGYGWRKRKQAAIA